MTPRVFRRSTATRPTSRPACPRWVTRLAVDPLHRIVYATSAATGRPRQARLPHRRRGSHLAGPPVCPRRRSTPSPSIPNAPSVLYVGTDVGVYCLQDTGQTWQELGMGLPRAPVLDLAFHAPTRMLAAGTHGRSLFTITAPDVTTPVAPMPPAPVLALGRAQSVQPADHPVVRPRGGCRRDTRDLRRRRRPGRRAFWTTGCRRDRTRCAGRQGHDRPRPRERDLPGPARGGRGGHGDEAGPGALSPGRRRRRPRRSVNDRPGRRCRPHRAPGAGGVKPRSVPSPPRPPPRTGGSTRM